MRQGCLLAFVSVVVFGSGCGSADPVESGDLRDVGLTPAGEQLRDDPTAATGVLEDIAAAREASDEDIVMATVIVAILVRAEETGGVHPIVSDPAFGADVLALTRRYPELFGGGGDTGSSSEPLVSDPDQTVFGCEAGDCDIDRAAIAWDALGAIVGLAGIPGIARNRVLVDVIERLNDAMASWSLVELTRDLEYDRATWSDVLVTVGSVGLGLTVGTSAAMIGAIGGAVIGVAQLASRYHLLLNAQQRCVLYQRSASCAPEMDGGTVDAGTADAAAPAADAGPDCPGSPTAIRCDGICLEPSSNHMHCGGCGNVCSSGLCVDGACTCSDPALVECGASGCVDLRTDRAHCGGCGVACATDEVCAAGTCGGLGAVTVTPVGRYAGSDVAEAGITHEVTFAARVDAMGSVPIDGVLVRVGADATPPSPTDAGWTAISPPASTLSDFLVEGVTLTAADLDMRGEAELRAWARSGTIVSEVAMAGVRYSPRASAVGPMSDPDLEPTDVITEATLTDPLLPGGFTVIGDCLYSARSSSADLSMFEMSVTHPCGDTPFTALPGNFTVRFHRADGTIIRSLTSSAFAFYERIYDDAVDHCAEIDSVSTLWDVPTMACP